LAREDPFVTLFRYATLALVCVLAGCATTATIEPEEVAINRAEGQFVPVRVFFNRSIPVLNNYVDRLEAVEAALKESRAFFDAGPYVDSPIILDIELSRGSYDTAVNFAGQMLSAATLFVVPTKTRSYNLLKVSVYAYGTLLKSYEFKQDFTQVLGVYNYRELVYNEDNEFLSIRNLVNQFVNALDTDNLLPKVKLNETWHPIIEDAPREAEI
jgi:hypothetical protein